MNEGIKTIKREEEGRKKKERRERKVSQRKGGKTSPRADSDASDILQRLKIKVVKQLGTVTVTKVNDSKNRRH